jgi:hypothetical protein
VNQVREHCLRFDLGRQQLILSKLCNQDVPERFGRHGDILGRPSILVNHLLRSDALAHDLLSDERDQVLGCSELLLAQDAFRGSFSLNRGRLQTHSQQKSMTVD